MNQELDAYIKASKELKAAIELKFPIGCLVNVKSARYTGGGKVVGYSEHSLVDIKVELTYETWWYYKVWDLTPL